MSRHGWAAGLGLAALLASSAAGERGTIVARASEAAPRNAVTEPGETPESVVARWPARTRAAAGLLLEKYGAPDQFDRDTLVWFDKGAWKKTIVHRRPSRRAKGVPDFLEQSIGYLVPARKIPALERFHPMIEASPAAGELAFSSESETKNLLALNLADEIVTGKRGVADARAFFRKTARLSESGKSSAYLDSLMFDVDNARYMTPTGADQ